MIFNDPYKKGQEILLKGDFRKFRSVSSDVLASQSKKTGLSLFHYFIINSKTIDMDADQVVDIFLKGGVNISSRSNKEHGYYTALHFAVEYPENFGLTKLLIERGIDSSLRDEHGNTAFWNACSRYRGLPEQKKIIEYLFDKGASVREENKHGISVEKMMLELADSIEQGLNPKEWDLRTLKIAGR